MCFDFHKCGLFCTAAFYFMSCSQAAAHNLSGRNPAFDVCRPVGAECRQCMHSS
jgi:hypothetical protein